MAWTTPMTATAGAFSAAQWNTYVRDNLNATEAGIAALGSNPRWFVASGSKALAQREIKQATVDAEQTTSSSTFTNLSTSGPAVTITTGTKVLVSISARIGNNTVNSSSEMSFDVSGATTDNNTADMSNRAAISDGLAAASSGQNIRSTSVSHLMTVNAGSNTFTCKYRAEQDTARFAYRRIVVWAF